MQMLLTLIRGLLVASVLVPAAVFGLFAWHSYHLTVQSAADRAQRFAAVVQEHTLKVFETIGFMLQAADQRLRGVDSEAIRSSKELWDDLKRLEASSDQVGSIFVVDRDGLNVFTTRSFPSPPVNFSDRDYYHEQREADQGLFVGRSYHGKISNQQIFNFSIRRASASGAFLGVVGVSAYVNYFEDFYRSVGMAADGFAIALVRGDGSILVRYPSLTLDSSKIASDHPFMQNLRAGERGTFFARSPFNGLDRLYGYVRVRGFPVYAVYGVDQRAITETWLQTIYKAAALTLTVSCCLFLTAWFALKRAKHEALAVETLSHTTRKLGQEIEKRERAEASLMQAQRLEAVGQLTGSIAHDFNNLLTIISGNLELAERRNDLNAIRRMLAAIRYATDRATSLTRQLLAFSRRNMLNPKTVSMNLVLQRARVLIEHSLPENVQLQLTLSAELCPVRIDVGEFEAAVLNLIVNSRDAMPNGGTLKLSTDEVSLPPDGVAARRVGPGAYIELRIEDTGCGMTPETLARVYEPFFTTKEIGKGTGLGLSQVYGFVQQCAGSIAIDSEVGRGTRVSILLPRSAEPIALESDALAGLQQLGRPATILVVEDDAEVRKTSVAILHDLGHSILLARNGAEALALLTAGDSIDILFTDIMMPGGINGIELAKRAVAARPGLKVLVATGYPGHAELLHSDFLVLAKPFTRVDLQRAIRTLLDRAGRERDGPAPFTETATM
jgi:signal transduction histidine kinase/CheY-like chemotaxis protein